MKAWSQNLSHEGVLTTLTSYGAVSQERQEEILHGLNRKTNTRADPKEPDAENIQKVLAWLQRKAS